MNPRTKRIVTWLSCGVVAGVCALVSPTTGGIATASADPIVDVRVAPPRPRVEVIPARPSPNHFWIHGHYAWNGREHYWVPGRYEVSRPGYGWREARWEGGGGHYHYVEGGWYRR